MDVVEALKQRRSIRAYLDRPVPVETIKAALAAAARAPSSGNLQPWRVYVLTGQPLQALVARMDGLIFAPPEQAPQYSVYPSAMDDIYRDRLKGLVAGIFALEGVAADKPEETAAWGRKHFRFFGAPVGLFLYVDSRMGSSQWVDLGAYLQSLMLVLAEQGLSTCAEAAWSQWWAPVSQFLNTAETLTLVCGLAVGYADPAAPINGLTTPRAPVEDFAQLLGFD